MLRRYPDAIRSFVTILNFILRMRQYHTRSYQYDQVGPLGTQVVSLLTPSSDQQNRRQDVRPFRDLQRPLSLSLRR